MRDCLSSWRRTSVLRWRDAGSPPSRRRPSPRVSGAICWVVAAWVATAGAVATADLPSAAQLTELRAYIKTSWTTLTRSNRDLPVAARDPKLHLGPEAKSPVYLSAREDRGKVESALRAVLGEKEMATLSLRTLDSARPVTEHGLLYLPKPYVVPGGRFNEMYGWDSYFILVGLLRDGETPRARDMVENFLYEIDHYGTISTRTGPITSVGRSHRS